MQPLTAPADIENVNVFDEPTSSAFNDSQGAVRNVPLLNPAIRVPDTGEPQDKAAPEPDSVSKKDEKSMTPARRWAAIRLKLKCLTSS